MTFLKLRRVVAIGLMLALPFGMALPALAAPAACTPERSPARARAEQVIRAEITHLDGMSKTFKAERVWLAPLPHGAGYRFQARVRCVVSAYEKPRALVSLTDGTYDPRSGKVTFRRLPAIP